jgi:hypothetical protein
MDSAKCKQATQFVLQLQRDALAPAWPVTFIKKMLPPVFGGNDLSGIITTETPVVNSTEIPSKIKLPEQRGGILGGFK